ncbi:MAG: cyclic nucleotide-binding domain-containing protein, partial [Myxococcota bacterium]
AHRPRREGTPMSNQHLTVVHNRHPICAGIPPTYDDTMVACAHNLKFDDGRALFRNGEEAAHSFLIRQGRVRLVVHGVEVVETAEEGDLVGWSWLFPPQRYHFDAIAAGPVRAFQFDGGCLRRKCEAEPAFGFELTRRILEQATRRLERSRLQALDVYR